MDTTMDTVFSKKRKLRNGLFKPFLSLQGMGRSNKKDTLDKKLVWDLNFRQL